MSVEPSAVTAPPAELVARLDGYFADEPAWHRAQRLEALAHYDALPVPERQRTPLKGRRLESIPYLDRCRGDVPEDARENATVLLTPGGVADIQLSPALSQAHVVVMDLAEALHRYPDLVRDVLGQVQADAEDRYTALNRAFWHPGLFCYVPPGAELTEPITIVHWIDEASPGYLPRVAVLADKGSRATVVETLLGSPADTHRTLVSEVLEVHARSASRVTVASIQQLPPGAEAFVRRRAQVERDARVDWHTGEFGAALSVAGHASLLHGAGSSMSSVTVFYGTRTQHQDYTAEVVHQAPHTRSNILARGVMGDRARSIFTGQSVIVKGAVGTDARQKEQTLMLSDEARADAIPSLKIDDNDVFAAHSASAGPVDPTALYYLESRGLDPQEARRVVIRGFLEPVLASLAPSSVQERVRGLVEEKLGGGS
jgi:Fe-S cluster assembly protein SufD